MDQKKEKSSGRLREVIGMVGVAAITVGAGLIYLPAGLIVGGLFAIAWAVLDARIA